MDLLETHGFLRRRKSIEYLIYSVIYRIGSLENKWYGEWGVYRSNGGVMGGMKRPLADHILGFSSGAPRKTDKKTAVGILNFLGAYLPVSVEVEEQDVTH